MRAAAPASVPVHRLAVDAPLGTGRGAAVLDAYAEVFGPVSDGRRMLEARRAESGHSCRYASDAGQVVAFAWGSSVPPGSWWPTQLARVLEPAVVEDVLSGTAVSDLGVRSTHRRRGLGRAVLDALLADLDVVGGPVHLGTQADNDAARRLYEQAGFATVVTFHYPDDSCLWRLMRRPMPSG